MDRVNTYSLAELLEIVHDGGMIDRYEKQNAYITFYQGGSVYSLHEDHARSFLRRVVRAMSTEGAGDVGP